MASRANSKSQKIRDYLAANPDAPAPDIAKATRTSLPLVYAVKGRAGKRRGKRASKASKGTDLAMLVKAKKVVDQLGGIEQAQAAVNALARLL